MNNKIDMYFNKRIATDFAKQEQNEKNFKVADIVDQVIMKTVWSLHQNFKACELGWGAHPDRYHTFFKELIENNWTIDWVDISPFMLELALKYTNTNEYRERLKVINFIESDVISYLEWLEDNSMDLVIMKYTIDHIIEDIDELFALLQKKLKKWWVLVSNIWTLSPNLKSISTNARFLYDWEEFPENETKTLKDWDAIKIKFFSVSWKPEFWYIPWWETTKYYHSEEKYRETAEKYWFNIYLWDWKGLIPQKDDWLNQDILVLRKQIILSL